MTARLVPGEGLEPIVETVDQVRVLRFGATTHNAHRIHSDMEFARAEGLNHPVVMAQLQGTLFHRAAARAAGSGGRVLSLSWQNRAPAAVGETLTVSGRVDSVDGETVTVILEETDSSGTVCATGSAVVRPVILGDR